MAARAQRLARLLEIITLVQSEGGWGPKRLADHFGISETRIYQDIKQLCQAGIPIAYARNGYQIDASFFFPSLNLTPDEAALLLHPDSFFRDDVARPIKERVRAKLLSILPPAMRSVFRRSLEHTDLKLEGSTERDVVFEQMHLAVGEHRRTIIEYRSIRAEDYNRRVVDPYGLVHRKHAWYVVGLCHKSNEVRTFKLSRIRNAEVSDVRFAYPEGFSVQNYFSGRWGVFDGDEQDVVIRLKPLAARLVEDNPPVKDAALLKMSDGSAILRARVRGVQEIGWWVMKYGDQAEVIGPPALRQQVIDSIMGMAVLYRLPLAEEPACEEEAAEDGDEKAAEDETGYAAGRE